MPRVPTPARSVAEPAADPAAPSAERPSKHEDRREQLAESALVTLGTLGYAKTSLREIAQRSPFSHGVVHYYFSSKEELITSCVRHYKRTCVTRYDEIVASSTTAAELQSRFAEKLAGTIREEGPMHQLWYDLRNQSMFEPALREVVLEIDGQLEQMIWRVVSRYAELAGRAPSVDSSTCYGMLDGLFAQSLLAWATGPDTEREHVLSVLTARVHTLMPSLLG
ncbi:TetR/AcrR family transcriptional regulator [Nocardioides ganghwensis]|jgi:TetR/AcrR family transcriptional repressor of bet genes|uniref:TetR/AcrR family transcriptional regulator n=1 Tax=Nocardioides ganghwensis TaxID=252230 RepID=A0A4Q2SEH3_9ACTN|nr:TetR/AcrR family transcriptional regulator [Nocardioides ganghwensis]RYC01472.1 TetR/AcrR family transcriptional regulator [Nocardioides ganghwensis]